jgi:hypothetical protein
LDGLQLQLRQAALTGDEVSRLVYADWLEERNFHPLTVAYYRGEPVSEKDLHAALLEAQLQALLAEAQEAYANKRVSDGYWAMQKVRLLSRTGYLSVVIGADLRHPARPGEILVRPATKGKWSKSRADRYGRRLTLDDMLLLLEVNTCSTTTSSGVLSR